MTLPGQQEILDQVVLWIGWAYACHILISGGFMDEYRLSAALSGLLHDIGKLEPDGKQKSSASMMDHFWEKEI